MIRLYFLELGPEADAACPQELLNAVSPAKKARLIKYRNNVDIRLGVYGELLVRCLLAELSGVSPEDIRLEATPAGKPYCPQPGSQKFNISHTRSALCVALSDRPVGVDIERIRPVDTAFAGRIFSAGEMAGLDAAAQDDRARRFLEIWTKKEALIKYRGVGLSRDLKSVDVSGVLPFETIKTLETGGYIISVCSGGPPRALELITITQDELIARWRGQARSGKPADGNGEL